MANEMTFRIESKGEGMRSDVKSEKHSMTVDEPPNMGGEDTGPDPLTMMLSSLAGCENVVATMVAEELEFDLEGIDFDISGTIDPRGLQGVEGVRPYFQTVNIEAKVKTSESKERIEELQRITDQRCPVYTTMEAAGVELKSDWYRI
ncbi:OsmC family protein [Salimicrobium sp. PL1-032A]|uniref:OsmC family protein n=1 Tax=Salimicrobium sp. PL1-032A TaxID=3095364 RepID=UPI003260D8F1